MPNEPFDIALLSFLWFVASALSFAFLHGCAKDRHRAAVSRWMWLSSETGPDFRAVRARVVGEPGTWTLLGESDVGRDRTRVERASSAALVDEGGRPILLQSPVVLGLGAPVQKRPGPQRRLDDGDDYGTPPTWVGTEIVELPAGATLFVRGTVTEAQDRIGVRAAHAVLSLETGPGPEIPAETPPPPREPSVPALVAFSGIVQLPAWLFYVTAPPGLHPLALAAIAGSVVLVGFAREAIVDVLHGDGRGA